MIDLLTEFFKKGDNSSIDMATSQATTIAAQEFYHQVNEAIKTLDLLKSYVEKPKVKFNSDHHTQMTMPFSKDTELTVIYIKGQREPIYAYVAKVNKND